MFQLNETRLREEICRLGASLFARGLSFGSAGNISVRLDEGWLMTPTNVSLGRLDRARRRRRRECAAADHCLLRHARRPLAAGRISPAR